MNGKTVSPLAEHIFSDCRRRSLQTTRQSASLPRERSAQSQLIQKKKKKKGQERESDTRDRLNIFMISFEKCHKYDKHMYRPMTNALELSSSIWKMPLVLGLNLSHNPTPKKTNPNNCWRRNEAKPQLEGAAHKSHYKFHIFKYSNLICISDYVVKSDVMFADTWRFFFLPSCLFFVTLLHKSHKALTIYNIIL